MNENRIPTPNTYASPSALGVKPDARLQAAFLTHAFVWMFVGLLVSAAVAWAVLGNEAAAGLHRGQPAVPVHRPAGVGGRHLRRHQPDQRDDRPAAVLRLRGVAGPGDRADRQPVQGRLGRHRVPQRLGDVRRGGHLRRRDQALAREPRRVPVHGPDRAARRVRPEHLPAQRQPRLGHLDRSAS